MIRNNIAAAVAGGLAVLAVVSLGGCEQSNRTYQTFTVDSKESRIIGSGDTRRSVFFVYGTKGEVFRNEDVALNFNGPSKFDSATLQALLKPGRTYRVETIGWRNPFWSMYPNIVTAEDVTPPTVKFTVLKDDDTRQMCVSYGKALKNTGVYISHMSDLCFNGPEKAVA